MKKRFNAKKPKKSKKHLLLFIFIIIFFIAFSLVLKNLSFNMSDEVIINYILKNEDEVIKFENIFSPEHLLNYTFNSIIDFDFPVFEETNEETSNVPLVYIYNTHPTEYYAETNYDVFNITPTIVTASYMLKEYLEKQGIYSIVEEKSVTDILISKSWNYARSYDASRFLVEDAIKKYPTVEYYIDLHRDAASKETTTIQINGESCVRFMFVVGKEYAGYESNYELATYINSKLININERFTRGIILKEGEYVDGVYNQDLSNNSVLIEVGAQYNTIDEVNCGIKYLADILAEIIKEE